MKASKGIKSFLLLIYFIPLLIRGQLLSTIHDVKINVLENVGSCDSLLFRLLSLNQIHKNDTNFLCNTFKFKIQKVDTPLTELSCSIFASALIDCDIKNSISSAELLKQHFMKSNKPKMKDLYYLSIILTNLPSDIATVLGKEEILDDINEIINDEISKLQKLKSTLLDYNDISYLFGTISQLYKMGNKSTNYIKILTSILEWENKFEINNILSLESYVLYFSLLTRAYFYLKRPAIFTDVPMSIHQMMNSLSKTNINDIKSIDIVNEYIITRKLLTESGLHIIQGFISKNDKNKISSFTFCDANGKIIDGLELSVQNNNYSSYISIKNIPKTCEYELILNNRENSKVITQITDDLIINLFKIKISAKSIISKETVIPILNVNNNIQLNKNLILTNKKFYLSNGIEMKNQGMNEMIIEYNENIQTHKMAIILETNIKYFDYYSMFNYLAFLEIKALEPLDTIGTRTINLISAIKEKNTFKFFIDLTKDKLICSSSEFSIRFLLNNISNESENTDNLYEFKTNIIVNKNESTVFEKLCPFKIHPNMAKYYPKDEIIYKFKEPRKLPGPLFPYLFSIIILFFIVLLFQTWNKIVRNEKFKFNFSILKLLTFISLIISFSIILCYWYSLNIFQFAYIFTPNIIIFFILLRFSLNKKYNTENSTKLKND
ncbi:hypothetical protein FG386_001060 [Cryptosporidium ryanae]|uniref:uncharacterized protein n=1 Tax=Cryptosporidium ryanae TaxID=515981 RepID=UPI00351AA107|nr:hypothetical protein FG386_001060 [Cryptosporidium ryanae]